MHQLPEEFRGTFEVDDATLVRFSGASGILQVRPDAVAVPADVEDLALLVRWAAETRSRLIPRGAGTGMPGGNIGAGVVVDLLTPFRGVAQPDTERRSVFVEPGVTLGELNAVCAPVGLHFPVDPSSGERCSFGGMLANNSAGSHSVKYGAVRAWVNSLDLILANGSQTRITRGEPVSDPHLRAILSRIDELLAAHREQIEAAWPKVRKNSSGYALREYLQTGDAVDLLVGSEGTLALITGAELRLAPLPGARGVALIEFEELEAAGAAVRTVLELDAATCEILDRTFLELVRDAGADAGYPLRAGLEAILLVEVEGEDEEEVRARLRRIEDRLAGLADRISLATEPERQARFWQVRRAASPLIARRTDGRVSMQFIEDGVVPIERLPEYIAALRRVLGAHGIPAVIFGHAGDGNLHVNPLVDPTAPGWREAIEQVLYDIADVVAELGGTLAGEHGDGRLRAPLIERVWGTELVALFREVKNAFDPEGILNPGVILPLPGQRPLDALKNYAPRLNFESPEMRTLPDMHE